jgi:hypothetical protein
METFIILFIIILILIILLYSIKKYNIKNINDEINYSLLNNQSKNIKINNSSIFNNKIQNNSLNNNLYDNNFNNNELKNLESCQVPTLNTEQCYKSRHYECPIVNGSYLQCTNNYIPKPKQYNADCGNRTFDMVPYPWKISENCYYNKIGFNRNKEFGNFDN